MSPPASCIAGRRVSNLPGSATRLAVVFEQQSCCMVRAEETHAQNRTHRSSGAPAAGSFADLAVQHGLGLLSERWPRIDPTDRADLGACEAALASITGAPAHFAARVLLSFRRHSLRRWPASYTSGSAIRTKSGSFQ